MIYRGYCSRLVLMKVMHETAQMHFTEQTI